MDCLYSDAGGGSERQFLSFYKHCPDYGIELHVCFLRHQAVHDEIAWRQQPITLNIDRLLSLSTWRAARKVSAYIKEHDIELVQTLFDDAAVFSGLLYSFQQQSKPPLVIGLRNSGHAHGFFLRWHLRLAYSRARHFIVNADLVATYLQDQFHIDAAKISVLRNIFIRDSKTQNSGLQDLRAQLKQHFKTVGIVVASLRPVKGIDDLLAAIAQLEQPDVGFMIVGSGESEQEYVQLAEGLGITSQVLFLGRRDDISALLDIANFALLPSRAEGLSNALIEYVMAGLPVIATRVGGNPEVVKDGRNGLLVPPRDAAALATAISQLTKHISTYRTGAKQELSTVAGRYDIAVIMADYRARYLSLCRGGVKQP